ncbi:MAG: helix-turn-helix domain-containing protein [Chitinophagales bacterium]
MATKSIAKKTVATCTGHMRPVRDALEVLHGRWKLPILVSLGFGPKRFKEIARDAEGITDRMLSKELKEMELNQLVQRTVYDSFPPTVEYTITEHGKSLQPVIQALAAWGEKHRQKVMKR